MSDALALPFSVYGVNTGSYTISHAFSLSQNNSYYVTPDEYDLGAIIAAADSLSVMMNTPYYFLPATSGTLSVPAIYSGGAGPISVIKFHESYIEGVNRSGLTASVLLFRAA